MADDVLKSFLVAIGYKEDEASKRRFIDGLAKAEKAVASLSLALAAAATAATAAAVKMAASFEDLFYASQRTGASINNLRGLAYAVSQLGGSYGGAVQSLEAFARNVRTNPGYESMARKLGVATRENGKLRDTVDILTDLGKVFRGQKYEIAYQYATALGLDERTFQLLRDQPDALRRYRDEYERTTKALGTNSKEMTEQGKALSQSWRSFLSTMEAVSERIAATFFPIITKLLDYMREWVVSHGPQINAFWTQVGKGIEVVERAAKSAYETVEPFVSLFTKKLAEGFNASGGLSGLLKELKQLFSDLGDMVKRAYEYIVKLIQLVGLDKVIAGLGVGIRSGFREGDWTGGVPDWTGGKVAPSAADYAGGGGMPGESRTGKGALAPYRSGIVGRTVDRVKGWFTGNKAPSIRKGYQAGVIPDASSSASAANSDAAKALGDAIAGTESGRAGYNAVLGNGQYGTPDKPISQMTLTEARAFGRKVRAAHGSSSALGRYQIVNTTRDAAQRALGIPDDALYNAETQERMMRWIARNQGLGAWEGLKGNPRAMAAARAAMAAGGSLDASPERRPVGQATNVSDAQVIANDHGHYARLNKALGGMDFTARHGASEAPLGVTNNDNSSAKTLNMPQNITVNVQGGGSAADTANATVRGLTRFQELSLRNAQGAIQ